MLYFFMTACASFAVDVSGYAGPDAIISSGSPRISLSTIVKTCAGAQCSANRPPFTALIRLRSVFTATMSAPEASSCSVRSVSSAGGIRGFSKSALPPPERRKSTVSSAARAAVRSSASCVAANEFASGTGCPASRQEIFGISPFICPYFVMTMPRSMRLPSSSDAARAICHAALPTATSTMRPVPNVCPRSAFSTAASGKIAANDSCMMPSASLRRFIIIAPFLLSSYYTTRFKRRLFLLSICMSPVIIDIERTSLAASFQSQVLYS